MFWDNKQVYTGCLNDSSRHIDPCAHTRSELVWWGYRSQTDVSECWSRRWVIQWALSVDLWETKIISHCTESENVHNKMLSEQWRKVALLRKTLSIKLRTSLYKTYSVYTWLNNGQTLKKKHNWCSFITTVFLTWNATECLYILLKLQQMSYKQQLKRLLTRLLESLSVLKQIWQKIFIDFVIDLLSSEGCTNLLIITNCLSKRVILKLCKNMTAEWVAQTFVQCFYWAHELFIAIVSDWDTQFVSSLWKRVCQLLKIVWRVFTAYHSEIDRGTEWMNQNVKLYICTFFNYS